MLFNGTDEPPFLFLENGKLQFPARLGRGEHKWRRKAIGGVAAAGGGIIQAQLAAAVVGDGDREGHVGVEGRCRVVDGVRDGQVDLRQAWLDTERDTSTSHDWLYFAWERDANSGSGFIAYEFMKKPAPATCAYATATESSLIADCIPWANRARRGRASLPMRHCRRPTTRANPSSRHSYWG